MENKNKYFSVMLIDDNEIDNIINSKMIESVSLAQHIYTHSSASSAIDFLSNILKLSTPEDNKLPKYIFLDIDMPMMDGFQFFEEFGKLDSRIKEYCQVIVLTASANPQDKQNMERFEGFTKYLNKPLKQADLQAL